LKKSGLCLVLSAGINLALLWQCAINLLWIYDILTKGKCVLIEPNLFLLSLETLGTLVVLGGVRVQHDTYRQASKVSLCLKKKKVGFWALWEPLFGFFSLLFFDVLL
jgi:hypothetical protein